MDAATAVLVHGPCGTPAAWSRMIPFLDDVGVPNVAVHLPSSLPASELDDGAHLQSVLDGLEGPTVLMGHSGGGFPITRVGEHPGARHRVYLDGALPDVGETLADQFEPGDQDKSFSACIKLIPGGAAFDTDALATHLQDRAWPAQEAREFTSGMVPTRAAAQVLAVTVASWRTVPSTFIGCATARLEAKRGHDSRHARCTRSRSQVTTSRCGNDPASSPRSSPVSPTTPSPHKGWGCQPRAGITAVIAQQQRRPIREGRPAVALLHDPNRYVP
jgi:Alpha/beta hydrolase family